MVVAAVAAVMAGVMERGGGATAADEFLKAPRPVAVHKSTFRAGNMLSGKNRVCEAWISYGHYRTM